MRTTPRVARSTAHVLKSGKSEVSELLFSSASFRPVGPLLNGSDGPRQTAGPV